MRDNLDKELKIVNAKVYDYKFKNFECSSVLIDGEYCIGINDSLSENDRFWILEHELEHIKTKTLYHPDDDSYTINQKERITNDNVVLKCGLPTAVYKMLAAGYKKEEIIQKLEITESIYEHTCNYIVRNKIKFSGGSDEK